MRRQSGVAAEAEEEDWYTMSKHSAAAAVTMVAVAEEAAAAAAVAAPVSGRTFSGRIVDSLRLDSDRDRAQSAAAAAAATAADDQYDMSTQSSGMLIVYRGSSETEHRQLE
jgi:hypothetical protein